VRGEGIDVQPALVVHRAVLVADGDDAYAVTREEAGGVTADLAEALHGRGDP
jgi:hypothetical protein